MRVRRLDLTETRGWDEFVASSPTATLFHTSAWQRALAMSFGYRPCCLQAESGGRVVGVLPLWQVRSLPLGRHLCSVPMGNYGGVCAESAEAARVLLRQAGKLASRTGARFIELRNPDPGPDPLPTKTSFSTALLKLSPDPDEVWRDALRSNTRNRVRKAQRSALEVKRGRQWLPAFHQVFERNMRRLGSPAFEAHYLHAVFDEFGDDAECYCAVHAGRVVGGLVALAFRNTLFVPWASALREHFALAPNDLLYWTAIDEACRNGFRRFDFGRSSRGSGPLHFKLRWGAEERVLHYQYLLTAGGSVPMMDASNPRAALVSRAWSAFPLTVTRLLGHWARAQLAI